MLSSDVYEYIIEAIRECLDGYSVKAYSYDTSIENSICICSGESPDNIKELDDIFSIEQSMEHIVVNGSMNNNRKLFDDVIKLRKFLVNRLKSIKVGNKYIINTMPVGNTYALGISNRGIPTADFSIIIKYSEVE